MNKGDYSSEAIVVGHYFACGWRDIVAPPVTALPPSMYIDKYSDTKADCRKQRIPRCPVTPHRREPPPMNAGWKPRTGA
jgi:hypothetical protein